MFYCMFYFTCDRSFWPILLIQIPADALYSDDSLVPLWIPYVTLTIFLLILVIISFVRFHLKRISQNRERLEAIADQIEKDHQSTALLAASGTNGQVPADISDASGINPAASDFSYPMSGMTSPSSTYVPTYLDLFMSFSETVPVSKPYMLIKNINLQIKKKH